MVPPPLQASRLALGKSSSQQDSDLQQEEPRREQIAPKGNDTPTRCRPFAILEADVADDALG